MLDQDQELRFCKARRAVIEGEFQNLNPEQRRAALATEGPLLLLAGAGSGKTTVLIHRIANLMKYGRGSDSDDAPGWVTEDDLVFLEAYAAHPIPEGREEAERLCRLDPASPWSIIAITFTNKAAGELKERLERMLGPAANDIWASTFHSACVRILRRDIEKLGFQQSFTIYDSADSERVVKDILKDFNMDDKAFPPRSVLAAISRAKDAMKSGPAYLQECEKMGDFRLTRIAKLYVEYERRLREANALDFDDLILDTVRLLEEHEDVRSYYQNKFRYVLIDEYQDTNNLQYRLAAALAGKWENICVVGDDDQSIYRFRGATIENILSFEKQYRGARVIRLEQNYRSTKNILEASNAVIKHNLGRKGKELWTRHDAGDKVQVYTAMNENDEAQYVASQILTGFSQGRKWRDHAVLYRMNAQSNQIEQAFKRNGVPYRIIGGIRFFDRAEVKDMLAYLCALNNPADDLRLTRIINVPARGIGQKTVDTAQTLAVQEGKSLWEIIKNARAYPDLQKAAAKLAQFTDMMEELRALAGELDLPNFYEEVLARTGYAVALEAKNTVEDRTRLENVQSRPQRGLRGHDDHALGQGPGVSRGIRGGRGGGDLPGEPRHRRRRGDGGGAAAVLCGHDPRQGAALSHLRRTADALWTHLRQPSLPLRGGDPRRVRGTERTELSLGAGRRRRTLAVSKAGRHVRRPAGRVWWPWGRRLPETRTGRAPCLWRRPLRPGAPPRNAGGPSQAGRRRAARLPEGGHRDPQGLRQGDGHQRAAYGGRCPHRDRVRLRGHQTAYAQVGPAAYVQGVSRPADRPQAVRRYKNGPIRAAR